ncbi:MAG: fimbria/pilus periplasmic chaperone [Candidatus Eremiobacteraeota bacterium]|nr:fimbria/pilus periplasmic chaperone [Candidatus Eremiobacteraeota bacterium]
MKVLRHSKRCVRGLAATALALSVLLWGRHAEASAINVQPLDLHLKATRTSDTIAVENRGSVTIRVQVTGFAWDEDPQGKERLLPTHDLVFFPWLLTIEPGKKKSVRVGLQNTAPTPTERTFRIFIEELPSLESQILPNTTGVILRTKFGIPVFLDPVKISPKPDVSVKGIRNGVLTIAALNSGNAHYMSTGITVTGSDARGTALFDRAEKGWYILANGERQYEFPLGRKECSAVHDLTIVLSTTSGNVRQTIPVSAASCPKD